MLVLSTTSCLILGTAAFGCVVYHQLSPINSIYWFLPGMCRVQIFRGTEEDCYKKNMKFGYLTYKMLHYRWGFH